MDALVSEIKHRLRQLGIESPSGPNIRPLNTEQKALLIRVIIFGAFYPNYFSRQATSGEEPEREAVRALCGSDPYSTVRLGSFPSDQPHLAYTRQIKNQVENHIFSNHFRYIVANAMASIYQKLIVLFSRNIFKRCMECERLIQLQSSVPSLLSRR